MLISETPSTIASFLKQKVNSFLCIALISLLTFWVLLYYLSVRSELIVNNWTGSYTPVVSDK
jgi:hypothetical protein